MGGGVAGAASVGALPVHGRSEVSRASVSGDEEAAPFMLDFLVEDPHGRLVTNPSYSPENAFMPRTASARGSPTGRPWICRSSRICSARLIAAADAGGRFGASHAAGRDHAPAGAAADQPGDGAAAGVDRGLREVEPGHRHISHLYAVYPGSQITPRGTPALAAAARTTLDDRLAHGGGQTGWSRAWIINMLARFGDGDEAYDSVRALLRDNTSVDAARSASAAHLPDRRQQRRDRGGRGDAAAKPRGRGVTAARAAEGVARRPRDGAARARRLRRRHRVERGARSPRRACTAGQTGPCARAHRLSTWR